MKLRASVEGAVFRGLAPGAGADRDAEVLTLRRLRASAVASGTHGVLGEGFRHEYRRAIEILW